jgi:hypothetical protein
LSAVASCGVLVAAQELTPTPTPTRQFLGIPELGAFSKSANAEMLGYFPNSNVVMLMRGGEMVPLKLDTKLSEVKGCCNHRATPSLSHRDQKIAYVHVVPGPKRREAVAIYDTASEKSVDVFEAAAIWSLAWSPDDGQVAAVADGSLAEGRSVYLISADAGKPAERIHVALDIKGMEYQVSNYSTPSWSPDGKQMAIELRRRGMGSGNSAEVEIGLLELESRAVKELTAGVDPSWSPVGDEIAYYGRDRKRCFGMKTVTGEKRLLFSVGKRGAGAGRGPLFYPVVWSPDASQLLFHQWVDPDLITDIYRVAVTTGKAKRLGRTEVQAVAWRSRD